MKNVAVFNTKIASDMKYNGSVVSIIDYVKGKVVQVSDISYLVKECE